MKNENKSSRTCAFQSQRDVMNVYAPLILSDEKNKQKKTKNKKMYEMK